MTNFEQNLREQLNYSHEDWVHGEVPSLPETQAWVAGATDALTLATQLNRVSVSNEAGDQALRLAVALVDVRGAYADEFAAGFRTVEELALVDGALTLLQERLDHYREEGFQ